MWSYKKNNSLAIFDSDWQYPAVTEQFAAQKMAEFAFETPFEYIGFPWATLIDLVNREKKAEVQTWMSHLEKLENQQPTRRVTVSQHISTFKRIGLFKDVGITDIFCSHATTDNYLMDGIRIHPFPIFPVQVPQLDIQSEFFDLEKPRKYLYSFIGAYTPNGYLSDIRKKIVDDFNHPRGNILMRGEWHYEKIVYQEQINKKKLDSEHQLSSEQKAEEYKEVLKNSTFSLCPSGTGPNSIRLWESIGALSIPVIFSDSLRLPGDQALWNKAALIFPESMDKPEQVIKVLEEIEADKDRLRSMRKNLMTLWFRYGLPSFVYDIKKLAGH